MKTANLPVFGSRIAKWAAEASSRFGWRQILLACGLVGGNALIGPVGGSLVPSGSKPDPIVLFLSGEYLLRYMPMIFLTMIADAAYRDGVPAWRAYSLAWLFGSTTGPLVTYYVVSAFGVQQPYNRPIGLAMQLATQGGLLLWMYVHWRTTRQMVREVQTVERARAEDLQRLRRTRLKELQVRIDPQLLFDTLTDVGEMHAIEAARSRTMFDDLIVYLRTLQPSRSSEFATIDEEAALASAWWRVRLRRMVDPPPLTHVFLQGISSEPIAPTIVIALIEVASIVAKPSTDGWSLAYTVESDSLRLRLEGPDTDVPTDQDAVNALRLRVEAAYGELAVISTRQRPFRLELDLPRIASEARA